MKVKSTGLGKTQLQCHFDGFSKKDNGDQSVVMVITSTHDHRDPRLRAGAASGRSVTIADGCWLASRATVLPGVHVGEGCVIAAGAVVVRDCAPHGLYVGVPARRVRDLPTGD